MTELPAALFIILTLVFLMAIIVFGYRKDYRDNPSEFFKTLIGMPLSILMEFSELKCLVYRIRDMVLHKRK